MGIASKMTVRTAFFEVCRQLGMTTIFGNPGSTEETMLENYPEDFGYVLVLQEASAVAMADAYALRTGRATLVNLHTAAGMGNALGNIESACYNRAPLVIVAGQQTREMLLHEPYLINPAPHAIAAPFVKWSYETTRAEDAPAALLRAYAAAVQAPAGPVFLSIPMDDFEAPFDKPIPSRRIEGRLGADADRLRPVIEALETARAPALVLGGAVDRDDGWQSGVRLAERLNAKVWAPPSEGRPGFPETHRLYRGVLPAAIKPLGEALDGCDVVVVIGAPVFRYYPFVGGPVVPEGSRLFHVTDNPGDAGAAWIGDSFLADPARACAVLADALPPNWRAAPDPIAACGEPEAGERITPDFLYAAIGRTRPADSVIVQESLSTMKALRQRLPTSDSRSFFSMSSGVLGYGLPAAVGVALAEREVGSNRKVVAIVGDGSANYVIQALWTAAQHRTNIFFIIVANGAYNILKSFQQQLGTPGVPGLDIPALDFTHLSAGYGVAAQRVADPAVLDEALRRGMAYDGPFLLEVKVDDAVPPLL